MKTIIINRESFNWWEIDPRRAKLHEECQKEIDSLTRKIGDVREEQRVLVERTRKEKK